MVNRKTRTEEELCHKKCEKIMKKKNFDVFSQIIPDQPGSISRPKKQYFYAKNDDFLINGAKHSPLSLPLDWPSAGFGGLRASAVFWAVLQVDSILPFSLPGGNQVDG